MVLAKRAKFFGEEIYPEPEAELVGYSWLINEYQLRVPAPNSICAIVPAKSAMRNTMKPIGQYRCFSRQLSLKLYFFD